MGFKLTSPLWFGWFLPEPKKIGDENGVVLFHQSQTVGYDAAIGLNWLGPNDHRPVEDPRVRCDVVVGDPPVMEAAVVPHDGVAIFPAVRVDEPLLADMRSQLGEERLALVCR